MKIALGIQDDTLRSALREILENEGHKVFRANGGTALLKILPTWQPIDLVIVDVRMPDITCLEVIRMIRCRQEYEKLPVVVVGFADRVDLRIIDSFSGIHVDLARGRKKPLLAAIKTVAAAMA